jgi:hypothetical protein
MTTDFTSELQTTIERCDRVIIAASVAAIFGRPAAIRRIRAVPGHGTSAWTREGRLAIQECHQMAAPLVRLARPAGEL